MNESSPDRESQQRLYEVLMLKATKAPTSAYIQAQLGLVCLELGNREDALSHFLKALKLNPKFKEVKEKLRSNFSEEELGDVLFLINKQPFWKDLNWTINYPFAKQGKIIIIAGSILFTFMSIPPLAGTLILLLFIYPFVMAYMLKIIRASGEGKQDMPDWPEINDYWDSVLRPALLFLAACMISYAPFILLLFVGARFSGSAPLLILFLIIFLGLGSLYLPIALIAAAQFENFLAPLHIPLMIRSIGIIKKDYFIALGFLIPVIILGSFLAGLVMIPIPIIGQIIFWIFNLYFLTLQMNILGNIYYVNEDKLNWFKLP